MAIYLRGATWWADVTIDGQRTRQSLETSSQPEARRRERELIRTAKAKPSGKSLHSALTLWLDERERGRSDLSILGRLSKLPDLPADRVTDAWVRENLGSLGPANYNRHVAVIHAALDLAHTHGWIPTTPKISKRRPPPARTRFLTRAEWQALYENLPEHLRPLCAFALATGLRQENVLRLRWSAVDLERRQAWVSADETKAGKPLSVPLSPDAVAILEALKGGHPEFVFTWPGPETTDTPPTRHRFPYKTTPKTAWLAAVKAAGLTGVTFHTLRHTWASWHVMAGTPLPVLQQLGGWASITMVQRYAHLSADHIAGYAGRVTVCAIGPSDEDKNSIPS